MRLQNFFLALLATGFALPLLAQDELDTAALNSAAEMQRQVTEVQRTMIITDKMGLTATESDQFWPLYREYRAEVGKLNDRYVKMVTDYAESYESLDDDVASRLLKEAFSIDAGRTKVSKKYAKKFGKFLPGAKVVRFVQIESRLDAIMDIKIKNSIPLAM